MKAKNHLATHIIIVIFFLVLAFYFSSFNKFATSLLEPYKNNILVLALGLGLYFLGAILPDSDSWNRGSYIFYTKFAFLAYTIRILEYPIRLITGRKKGHRQSLHTILGIIVISLSVSIIISTVFSLFSQKPIFSNFFVFWTICLFIGQFFHLIEDKIVSPKWKIKLI